MRRLGLVLFFFCAFHATVSTAAESAADIARRDPGAFAIVDDLVTEVGARPSGSPMDPVAVKWALATMKRLGLTNVHSEALTVKPWRRGLETASIVAPITQKLVVTALGRSGATPADGLTAPVVEFSSLDELQKQIAATVHGKIVFINQPMTATKEGTGYGVGVGARAEGGRVAEALGAVAFLIRSVGSDHNRLPHTGAAYASKIAAAALSVPDAELLHRLLAREGGKVEVHLLVTPEMLPDTPSANVSGELPGTGAKAKEVVLLGAHLDSWDLAQGAIDDGAGCGIVLEAARLLSHQPLQRTVRVVLFANEEMGAVGAKAYAAAHQSEVGQIVMAMEADLGAGKVYEAHTVAGDAGPLAALRTALASVGVNLLDGDGHPGTDIRPLLMLGVPALSLEQDATTYFDHHHSANDTLDKVDPVTLEQAALSFATAAQAVANAETSFGRVPESKRN